jgi:hypothetical protein
VPCRSCPTAAGWSWSAGRPNVPGRPARSRTCPPGRAATRRTSSRHGAETGSAALGGRFHVCASVDRDASTGMAGALNARYIGRRGTGTGPEWNPCHTTHEPLWAARFPRVLRQQPGRGLRRWCCTRCQLPGDFGRRPLTEGDRLLGAEPTGGGQLWGRAARAPNRRAPARNGGPARDPALSSGRLRSC